MPSWEMAKEKRMISIGSFGVRMGKGGGDFWEMEKAVFRENICIHHPSG